VVENFWSQLIMREMIFGQEIVYWTICLIGCHAEHYSGSWGSPSVSGKLSWSTAGSSTASTPVSFNRIHRPKVWGTSCNDLDRYQDYQVRNVGGQLIRVTIFCQESVWSHIVRDRKGNAAIIFHHMIVCTYVATKT
jgi:hypothetical protein